MTEEIKMTQRQANMMADLGNLMQNLPKDHEFNINTWSEGRPTNEKDAVDCGTACCAVGWGCLILKSWHRAGLSLDGGVPFFNENYFYGIGRHDLVPKIFGMSEEEFDHMFMPDAYNVISYRVTPKMVARRIWSLLAKKGYDVVEVDA